MLKLINKSDDFCVVIPRTKTYGKYKGNLKVMTPNGIKELPIKYDRENYTYYICYERKRHYLTIVSYTSQFPNFEFETDNTK